MRTSRRRVHTSARIHTLFFFLPSRTRSPTSQKALRRAVAPLRERARLPSASSKRTIRHDGPDFRLLGHLQARRRHRGVRLRELRRAFARLRTAIDHLFEFAERRRTFDRAAARTGDWRAYTQYAPEVVMRTFRRVFVEAPCLPASSVGQ